MRSRLRLAALSDADPRFRYLDGDILFILAGEKDEYWQQRRQERHRAEGCEENEEDDEAEGALWWPVQLTRPVRQAQTGANCQLHAFWLEQVCAAPDSENEDGSDKEAGEEEAARVKEEAEEEASSVEAALERELARVTKEAEAEKERMVKEAREERMRVWEEREEERSVRRG